MNIKNKIALNLSLLFSVFLGTILIIIYLFFAEFRKSEFVNVLKDRISTISNYFNEDEAIVDESKMINDTPTYSIHQEEIEVLTKSLNPFSATSQEKKIFGMRATFLPSRIPVLFIDGIQRLKFMAKKLVEDIF